MQEEAIAEANLPQNFNYGADVDLDKIIAKRDEHEEPDDNKQEL